MTKRKYFNKKCKLSSKYLRITHWNIGGIISDNYGNKFEDPDFLKLINGEDIIAITETHIGEHDKLSVPGYVVKRKVRKKSRKAKKYSGGIALIVKKELESSIEILKSKSDNILWSKIKCSDGGNDFLLGTVYISPLNSTYSKNVLCNQFKTWEILTEEIAFYKSKYRIGLVGDFNARTGILPDYIINDDGRYVGLPDNYIPDIDIISRANSDLIVNKFGKQLNFVV